MATLNHLHLSPQGFLFDHHSGLSFSTNSTGAWILDRMIKGAAQQEILNGLVEDFDVSPDQAALDLEEFLTVLRQHRVLPRERKVELS
ncbi:MAG: PqqD family protein [Candidatus Delongbacteria bacterium]